MAAVGGLPAVIPAVPAPAFLPATRPISPAALGVLRSVSAVVPVGEAMPPVAASLPSMAEATSALAAMPPTTAEGALAMGHPAAPATAVGAKGATAACVPLRTAMRPMAATPVRGKLLPAATATH
jgi:hypothetical protein